MNESLASKLVLAFKVVAILEALTWVWLLYGMYGKWVGGDVTAVAMPGKVHGGVFVVLAILTVAVAYARKWDIKTLILGGLATILPFCSVVFEVWAQRAGKLDAPASRAKAAETAGVIGG